VCESEPHDRGARLRAEGAGHEAERLAVVDPGRARAGRDGVTLSAPITFLVGENGSGKSTIVEAVEEGWGVDVRGGQSGRKYSSELEKSVLGASIRLDAAATVPQW
jgi:predicted ATPase